LHKDLLPCGVFDVQGDPQLVSIEIKEKPASFRVRAIVEERCPFSGLIANRRLFDLDYLGTEVGQQLGAIRPGYQLTIFEHLYPC